MYVMNDCIHKNVRSANSVFAVPYFVKHVCQFGLQLYRRVKIYSPPSFTAALTRWQRWPDCPWNRGEGQQRAGVIWHPNYHDRHIANYTHTHTHLWWEPKDRCLISLSRSPSISLWHQWMAVNEESAHVSRCDLYTNHWCHFFFSKWILHEPIH